MFKPVSPQVDFPKLERELLDKWYREGIVKKYLRKNDKSEKKFSFLDGPITANNPMGVHHAWGRTYKDLWQRFWNMRGYKQRFQSGFDEQGLWVEVEVEKELGFKNKKDIEKFGIDKFINLCKERVKKYSAIQTEQSKRLGYFMDWDNSYHTSSDENNYAIWNFLKVVHKNGWLYKGRDSVPWCPRCGTAISQHEILTEEYKEITHKTVVVKFPITTKGWENTYLLAWTTTPWTIPGNMALAVDKNLSYWKMDNDKGEKIIIINPTANGDLDKEEMLVNKLKLTQEWKKIRELKGKDLVGLEYEGPYDHLPAVKKTLGQYRHRVIATDPRILEINPAEGTGIVHIAPGAGAEDFKLGQKEKLPVVEEIDEAGVFLGEFDFLSNEYVKKAIPKIIEDLQNRNFVHAISDYSHRYPTCWRCKTELVWRVVDEWYIAMDRPSHKASDGKQTYREQMVAVAKKIKWLPKWGLDRELDWLKNMHDWLISKKRYWGLALPIWECTKCGNFEVISGKAELKEQAVGGWKEFEGNSPHRPWIDQVKIKCSKCEETISRIPDVGNPWLDAGIVPFSTMSEEWFPADFITESFPGQFKNWFYSLIAMTTALKNTNSFKTVLGFASARDEKGEEMHKSKGNAIEFNEAADKIGVDVMRWMYIRQDPEQNLNFGYKVADEIRRQFHLMLWNIYNFFVSYAIADKWDPKVRSKKLEVRSKNILDRWILSRLYKTIEVVTATMEKYEAHIAARQIEEFVSNLSLWYVRRSRDRVGPSAVDEESKQTFYETMYEVFVTLSKLLAPFMPFISENIYNNLTENESVQAADWPETAKAMYNAKLEEEMKYAMEVASIIHGFRKTANVKVRIPLKKLVYKGPFELTKEVEKVVLEEVNVYELVFKGKNDVYAVEGDTSEKNQDLVFGEAREIVRRIQSERKKLGVLLDQYVIVTLSSWPKEHEQWIKQQALIKELRVGEIFTVSA